MSAQPSMSFARSSQPHLRKEHCVMRPIKKYQACPSPICQTFRYLPPSSGRAQALHDVALSSPAKLWRHEATMHVCVFLWLSRQCRGTHHPPVISTPSPGSDAVMATKASRRFTASCADGRCHGVDAMQLTMRALTSASLLSSLHQAHSTLSGYRHGVKIVSMCWHTCT